MTRDEAFEAWQVAVQHCIDFPTKENDNAALRARNRIDEFDIAPKLDGDYRSPSTQSMALRDHRAAAPNLGRKPRSLAVPSDDTIKKL
ncbi:MAG: hypothetical protein M3N13_08510 [Candidatus Eremiobacteraeota bacterium]|nr:hypothetical protein [Candidatus Eremiobacteraeota bacterium]